MNNIHEAITESKVVTNTNRLSGSYTYYWLVISWLSVVSNLESVVFRLLSGMSLLTIEDLSFH